MNRYSNAARALPRDEIEQLALQLGPSDASHLRLVANDIEDEGIIELPGVDADRLRLLAAKLEDDECEIEALREHSANVHRALCEAIDDINTLEDNPPVLFVFISDATPFAPVDGLTPEQFSDLAVFVLDEIE